MMERRARRLLNLLLLSLLPFVGSCVHPTDLSATGRPEPQAAPSEPAAANLKIGALISTPRFTPVPNGFEGIDAEVGGAVAQWLEETPALRGYLRQGQLLAALRTEDIDVAVGILWPSDRKLPSGTSGFAYDTGELVRVCRGRAGDSLTVPRELATVFELTAEHDPAVQAQVRSKGHHQLTALLARVTEGRQDCTLASKRQASVWTRYAPDDLHTETLPVGYSRYVVYRTQEAAFGARLAGLFASGKLREYTRRAYQDQYGFLRSASRYHYALFHRQVERRLPAYEPLFRAAARHYGLDWRLLAAVSYQESNWQPQAVSPTGVRGLMMLTRRTARELGVKDRLDPGQAIWGGAQYLRGLQNALPPTMRESDRLWLSLAAYNMGLEGLARAQERARSLGLDPLRWADLAPLMGASEDAKWREAAGYVQRIRDYVDILQYRTDSTRV